MPPAVFLPLLLLLAAAPPRASSLGRNAEGDAWLSERRISSRAEANVSLCLEMAAGGVPGSRFLVAALHEDYDNVQFIVRCELRDAPAATTPPPPELKVRGGD